MARKHLSRDTKHFVRWSQKDRCFLCSFPLVIYCHLHHIISVNDCGPNHYLNLIGLCGNHHGMLENMKRTRSPSFLINRTNNTELNRWGYKAKAALAEFDVLEFNRREAMNKLLAPYWQSEDSLCRIFANNEPATKVQLSKMVINRDIELLDIINSMRPRIFFPKPSINKTGQDPYDILLMNHIDFQTEIDQIVGSNLYNIWNEKYDNTITLHLSNLGLPVSFHPDDDIFRFNFSTELNFSVREIRELSNYQIYSL